MIALAYYLLKVIVCSGVLFLYYHFALRNKIFHQWNRFYLLAIVVLSLLVPVLQFRFIHTEETSSRTIQLLRVVQSADDYMETIYIQNHHSMTTAQWLSIVYIGISAIILAAVARSFYKIYVIVKRHKVQLVNQIRFVATQERGTPFSFFHYIFWNEKIDINTPTGQQIFQHELVHVKEAHTFDKLFLQLILILFWCNPFFWLIRRELQLIHEFIADKKAVQQHDTAAFAAMILQAAYPHQFSNITSQFSQSSIKRRLLMLTKIQNPRINYISRILALPLIAFTVLAFTFRTKSSRAIIPLDKEITVVIDAGHGRMANGSVNGARSEGIYEDDIVLTLAKKVAEMNANNKINIVLTRTSGENVDLNKRVEIAKEKKADLFISLHMGASEDDANRNGIELLVSNKNTAFQKQSQLLASVLKEELATVYTTFPELRKRQVGSLILDKNVCPSVLIECGYVTNKKDRDFITGEGNQKLIAEKIITSIERYAAAVEKGATAQNPADTLPQKAGKDIKTININNNSGMITLSYTDGSSEALSIEEAKQKKLISEKTTTTQTQKDKTLQLVASKDKPIYYLDGKGFTGDVNNLDPNKIASINVLKNQPAISKYGEKGKNGVVEIFTKTENSVSDTVPQKTPVFKKPEVEASVDKNEWRSFLEKNLQSVIESAASKGMPAGQYTVNLKFLVKKDGSISDFKALNDPGYGLVQKVLEIIPNSPKWKPAEQNGRAVNSYHTQPITFVISEGRDSKEKDNSRNAYPNIGATELKSKTIHDLLWVNKTDEIVSFTMTVDLDNGSITSINHSGNQYNNADKNFFDQYVKPGHLMTIDRILIKIDGALKKIPGKFYYIRS